MEKLLSTTLQSVAILILGVGFWIQSGKVEILEAEVLSLKTRESAVTEVVTRIDTKIDDVAVKLDSISHKFKQPKKEVKPRYKVKKDSVEVATLEHRVFNTLLEQGIDSTMARIWVAIAKHESNNFNSGLFNGTNNLFGMTYPPKRPTLATGKRVYLDNGNERKFCTYTSVEDSVRDLVLYLQHRNYPLDISTTEEMVRVMKSKRYFEAPESLYLNAVKRHLSDLTIR